MSLAQESESARRGLGFALVTQGRENDALLVWRSSSGMPAELMTWGFQAWKEGEYQEAADWLERAAGAAPSLGDPWYYLGMLYEETGRPEQATEAYSQGRERLQLLAVGRSEFYFRLGQLAKQKGQSSNWLTSRDLFTQAAAFYAQAISLNAFSEPSSEAITHFDLADVLNRLGRDREALAEYEWVLAHEPQNYWANVRLGLLVWELDGDSTKAETLLLRALAVEEDKKWAYQYLGQLYLATGRQAEAVEMYRHVLALDPRDVGAQESLNSLEVEE
ncbi:MAG: tetratricopeptide repeat protein [Chloroflexi bacterium]|nr:tetratricopeptide repeat protein [Chloroflexota bacterium]MCI0579489.1 tetratricopeptide repeat protein [Chloroflexota bacterium]MCI0650192.1 tetratricopeptide repeat protein [Chloroflexota bacterium]MCI0729497.1 tetratricopeptide repeat protein [Chloroflexota bacterium]